MSSNLVKQKYMVVSEDESKRVIDNNERMRRRLEIIQETLGNTGTGGFVSGLAAEVVEVLPEDAWDESNVVKGSEDASALLEQAGRDVESMLSDAQAECTRMIEEAKARAEQEKVNILEQAKKQGYDAGMAQATAKERALEQEYRQRMQELENDYARQIETLEPQLVDVITDVYQHIFDVELSGYREILLHLINQTIHKAEGGRSFLVHVSKDDYAYINERKEQLLATLGDSWKIDVIESSVLGEGQCMIETENGIYDCGLGTQMEELKKKLMLLAWSKEE